MSYKGLKLGHYQLLQLVGKGGMSEVYLAEDQSLHRQVAIKVIRSEPDQAYGMYEKQESIRLFKREMQLLASFDHPNILPIYEADEQNVNGRPLLYMVTPYRKEGSLDDWLRQHGSIVPPQVVGNIIQRAADALQQAHDSKILHLDIKPSNFLIRGGKAKSDLPDLQLADFGIAKIATTATNMTIATRGTPSYMAPEQWQGHPVAATDQYALAIMAYQLLTGKLPFKGDQAQLMYQHFQDQPVPPSDLNPQISPTLDAIILRALSKNPADRFPSISTFGNAFQQALAATPVPAAALAPTVAVAQAPTGAVPPSKNTTLSATFLLYGIFTILLSLCVGAALYSFGKLPSYIVTTVSVIWGVLGAMVGAFVVNSKGFVGSIWQDAKHFQAIAGSIVTVVLLALLISSLPPSLSSARAPTNPSPIASSNTSTRTATGTATSTVSPTNTAIPDNYTSPGGTISMNDSLQQPDSQWSNMSFTSLGGQCQFANTSYQITATNPNYFIYCPDHTPFTNFVFEVQMTITQGDCGGVVFRDTKGILGYSYLFEVCQDGTYSLGLFHNNDNPQALIPSQSSAAIHKGYYQINTIAVVANGPQLTLYVNYQNVGQRSDSTYNGGEVGVVAFPVSQSTGVIYQDAKVWSL